jgi:starch-binding outer membrane protein, SusD/RagB family
MPQVIASRAPWPRVATILLMAGTTVLAACDPNNLLGVNDPDTVPPSNVLTKAGLPFLFAGVVANFQIAYSGAGDEANNGHEGQINMSGLLTDELIDLEQFPTRQQIDARITTPSNSSLKGTFNDLSAARAAADRASGAYAQLDPTNPLWPQVLDYAGYSYLMFAEYYCDGVPFSTLNITNGKISYGMPTTRPEVRRIVLAKFDSALTLGAAAVTADAAAGNSTANDSAVIYLARVGIARTLMDSNDYADAATIAATVPPGFVYLVENSTNAPIQFNGIWNYNVAGTFFSVGDSDGVTGLGFVSDDDPRVPTINTGEQGTLGSGPIFIQQNIYPQPGSSTVLASGLEAQLIIAEAQLKAGNVSGWAATLNALRADSSLLGMPPLAADSTTAATPDMQVDVMFRERAFWLYLTGHRMEDLRRLVRQYGRSQASVFPSVSPTAAGLAYGTNVDFPVSEDEQNNPNFHGCIDRNP